MAVYVYAAARDGEIQLSSVEADDEHEARGKALEFAGEFHDFDPDAYPEDHEDGIPNEDWFDGFELTSLLEIEDPAG